MVPTICLQTSIASKVHRAGVQAFKDLNLPKSFHPDLTNIMVLSLGCGEAQVAADPVVVDPSN